MGGDWTAMRGAGKNIESFDGDLIYFVENIDARNVDAVAFDHINQVISGGIAVEVEICIADLRKRER